MSQQQYSALFPPDTQRRHFSLARHALVAALRVLRIGAGDKVLLPEYVCRDLLAALREVGASPAWYAVDQTLTPVAAPDIWPSASAVLAVNYFGFPQSLSPFEAYAHRTGAKIIEDNAHGFLSRDEEGRLLGCRTAIGIFSYRKTFLLGRGAAITVNDPALFNCMEPQLHELVRAIPVPIKVRRWLRQLFGSRCPEYWLAKLIRQLRLWRGLTKTPLPAPDAEIRIPEEPSPDATLLADLCAQAFPKEAARRRTLYNRFLQEADSYGLRPLFPELSKHAVPYGFPVFAETADAVEKMARLHCLDCFRWPDLPDEVVSSAPGFYSKIYLINFL